MLVAGVLLLLIVVWFSFRVLRSYSKSLSDCKNLPCMKSWYLIGDIPKLHGNNREYFKRLMKCLEEFRERGILCLWSGIQPAVLIFKDEYVQSVIGNTKHMEKNFLYTFLHPWLGNGLLTRYVFDNLFENTRWFNWLIPASERIEHAGDLLCRQRSHVQMVVNDFCHGPYTYLYLFGLVAE
ncbi:cytochrome P450 4V2-like [Octopus bimaculoides]|uniref:cytochrome P450 4V2-like n=1 Tax=Octopus bimaculoides TaxID=37653 RepID=UPI0022E3882D|nr:cytochrome P450 4V2-like [Octopus bimaculoides]